LVNTIQAIALGVLQGATEFLPVSSSGHLVITKELFGAAQVPVLFDVLLHVATLVAVVIVLRGQVWSFLVAIGHGVRRSVRDEDRPYLRLIPIIIVTTAITGGFGIGLDSLFDIRNPVATSVLFLVTAILLIATRWFQGTRGLDRIGWVDALVLGIAQGFGVLPGISRSGATISVALYSGMDRKTAGEYSFLLSIPAILGALVLTLRDAEALSSQVGLGAVIAGCIAAAVVGYVALTVLLRIVRAGKLALFAWYLVPLGIAGILFFR
jgi:undecaprenyl-diphosphatase